MEQISGAMGQLERILPDVLQRLFPFYCNKTTEKPSAFGKAAQFSAPFRKAQKSPAEVAGLRGIGF
jgi:hypothetical protein